MRQRRLFGFTAAGLLAVGIAPAAFAHGVDIGVRFNSGVIETFGVDDSIGSTGSEPVQRVFEGELGTVEFGPFGTDDPGFFADTLTDGTSVGFNILSGLKVWNGAGFDGGTAETVRVANFFGTPGEVSATTGTGFVPGFTLVTASGGGFDHHAAFLLESSMGSPLDGIYLLEIELTSPGLPASAPLWIVFNLGLDEEDHELAVEWVEENLVPSAPTAALFAFFGAAGLRRRR